MKRLEKEYLFVDAYNIINAWQELKSLSNLKLELAREKLIEILAEYQAYTGIKVTVVFDAHLVKGSSEKKEIKYGVDIVYTKEDETADRYIEKILHLIGKHKKVKVATSDWIEQQIILGRGGTRISARELKIEIDNVKDSIKRKNKKNKEKNNNKNSLVGRIDEDILIKLEKMRKS